MARRKRQKNRTEAKNAQAARVQAQDSGRDSGAPQLAPPSASLAMDDCEPKAVASTSQAGGSPKRRPGVRLPTAVAGMFLTFVLGMYLGSLLPEMFQRQGSVADTQGEQPQPAPPPANASMRQELEQIISSLRERVQAEPDNAAEWIKLGNAYFDAQKPPQAIEAYEKALALLPDNADVWTDLGIMHRENHNPQRALECFRKALIINPAHQNSMFNEGVVLATDLNDKQGAAEAWGRLLAINPQAKGPDGRSVADMIKHLHLD